MEQRLPTGLQGMFRRVMDTLCDALREEAPELLELLRQRLLPVLVASREPLTVAELAWAVRGGEEDAGLADAQPKVCRCCRGVLCALIARCWRS